MGLLLVSFFEKHFGGEVSRFFWSVSSRPSGVTFNSSAAKDVSSFNLRTMVVATPKGCTSLQRTQRGSTWQKETNELGACLDHDFSIPHVVLGFILVYIMIYQKKNIQTWPFLLSKQTMSPRTASPNRLHRSASLDAFRSFSS